MNELIKQLAEQAGGHYGDGLEFAVVFGELEDFEKFALLIVKECAKIAYECGPTVVNGSERQFNPITYTGNQILIHFGVE